MSYSILVGDVLVRVQRGHQPIIQAQEVDESYLLKVLQDNKFLSSPSSLHFLRSGIFAIPNRVLRDIVNGDQKAIAEIVEEQGVCATSKRGIDILHLCALGGFAKSLEFLLSANVRQHIMRMADYSFGELAAIGGHTSILPFVIGKGKSPNMKEIRQIAMKFSQYDFMYKALCMEKQYKTERDAEILKVASQYSEIGFLQAALKAKMPERKRDSLNLDSSFPSLCSICAHVVAEESTQKTDAYASLLSTLPATVLEMVFEIIARDSRSGYRTLLNLRKQSPDLARAIPTHVWVEAVRQAESRTRDFYWHTSLVDYYYPQPLTDVFEEMHNAVIEPACEFEEIVTKFLPQEKEVGAPATATRDQFLRQLEFTTKGFLDGLKFSNLVVCGGCIATALHPSPSDEAINGKKVDSAIEVILYGLDERGYRDKIREVAAHVEAFKCRVAPERTVQVVKAKLALVFCIGFPFRHVRIVLGKFRNIWDILAFIEIDCCALAYDGEKLWASMRACLAWKKRWNITDPNLYKVRGFPFYEHRLVQHANAGFTIIDPLYHRFCHTGINEPTQLRGDEFYGWRPMGVQLIACIHQHEKVASQLAKVASRILTPYGPNVSFNEMVEFTMKRGLNLISYSNFISTIEFVSYEVSHITERISGMDWYSMKDKSE
eukprot:Phypoly_transcript_03838.p1 GENE.Phypoly_transcript_03838~~Phypoly_transcript_03838.p1  ORF type:complete len:660 (+),score=87.07 Phypoly_transcript_03838:56-2035(+)